MIKRYCCIHLFVDLHSSAYQNSDSRISSDYFLCTFLYYLSFLELLKKIPVWAAAASWTAGWDKICLSWSWWESRARPAFRIYSFNCWHLSRSKSTCPVGKKGLSRKGTCCLGVPPQLLLSPEEVLPWGTQLIMSKSVCNQRLAFPSVVGKHALPPPGLLPFLLPMHYFG